ERPEIMGQFVGCIEGMRAACLALDYPVVSGNVSFYNETNGKGIMPTPVVGGVGLIDDLERVAFARIDRPGLALLLIGDTAGHLGSSLYRREIGGREDGPPPAVDLAAERRNGDLVRSLIADYGVRCCHDLSDGGLLIAAAEMALAGDCGARIDVPAAFAKRPHAFLFGEDQARYLIAVDRAMMDRIERLAASAIVKCARIGETGGAALTVTGLPAISLSDLRAAHEGWLPGYMAGQR
ncbi:MAG: AIR synthase-related protein, partial [Dongiaceae bacterium]